MMWDSFFSAALHATGERPSVYTCVMLHTHSLVNLLKPCRLTRPTLFVNCLFPILLFGAAACELQVRSVLHSVSTHLHKRARCSLQCRNDTSPQKQRQLRETKGLYRNILRKLQTGRVPPLKSKRCFEESGCKNFLPQKTAGKVPFVLKTDFPCC